MDAVTKYLTRNKKHSEALNSFNYLTDGFAALVDFITFHYVIPSNELSQNQIDMTNVYGICSTRITLVIDTASLARLYKT